MRKYHIADYNGLKQKLIQVKEKIVENDDLNIPFVDLSLKNSNVLSHQPQPPPSSSDKVTVEETTTREKDILILKLKNENSELKLKKQDLEIELHNVKLRNSLLCQAMNLGES